MGVVLYTGGVEHVCTWFCRIMVDTLDKYLLVDKAIIIAVDFNLIEGQFISHSMSSLYLSPFFDFFI